MKLLITGAGGTIGSEIARQACARGDKIIMADRSEAALFAAAATVGHAQVRVVDVTRESDIRRVMDRDQPQIVIHAAAHKHVPMMEDCPAEAVTNNVLGTQYAAEAAIGCGAELFMLISTDKAVQPECVMGATKFLAEKVVASLAYRDTALAIARFGNIYRSSGSVVETWEKQAAAGGPITLTDPDMTRYFITVEDAAAFVLMACATDRAPGILRTFVPEMGPPVRMGDLAEKFAAERKVGIKIVGRRPGEKMTEQLWWPDEPVVSFAPWQPQEVS
jgi:UDP-N-acetylglucosamine 4,6-dehydratase